MHILLSHNSIIVFQNSRLLLKIIYHRDMATILMILRNLIGKIFHLRTTVLTGNY